MLFVSHIIIIIIIIIHGYIAVRATVIVIIRVLLVVSFRKKIAHTLHTSNSVIFLRKGGTYRHTFNTDIFLFQTRGHASHYDISLCTYLLQQLPTPRPGLLIIAYYCSPSSLGFISWLHLLLLFLFISDLT